MKGLLGRLPEAEAAQVLGLWDALLVARRDCEAMAARGVRVSRDISRDWQDTVSDLIDRVVAQDAELAQLRAQVKLAQYAAANNRSSQSSTRSSSSGPTPAASVEELHGQVVRLKRHRDRLTRDLADTQQAMQMALQQMVDVQVQACDAVCS